MIMTLVLSVVLFGFSSIGSARAQGAFWSDSFTSGKVVRNLLEERLPLGRKEAAAVALFDDPLPDRKELRYYARHPRSGKEFLVARYAYAPLRHGCTAVILAPEGATVLDLTFEKLDPGMRWSYLDERYPGQAVRRIEIRKEANPGHVRVTFRCVSAGRTLECFRLGLPENIYRTYETETLMPVRVRDIVQAIGEQIDDSLEDIGLTLRSAASSQPAPRSSVPPSRMQ
jgi:hypothetical protein